MRIDFREERKWKIALAYNLSTAVLEWHSLKTPEQRHLAGVTVKWHPPQLKDDSPNPGDRESSETKNALLGITYDSDEEMQDDQPQTNVVDTLEPATALEEVLDGANDIQPKSEVDEQSTMDLLRQMTSEDQSMENSYANFTGSSLPEGGLKNSSNNPVLCETKSSSQSTNGDAEPPVALTKPSKSDLNPIRQKIAYQADANLFLDMDVLSEGVDAPVTLNAEVVDPSDIQSLFPDLTPLGLLDLPVPPAPTDTSKKKSEKRLDKDDPNRRIDDTLYTKVYPTGRFMFSKPTLIGPLQPAKQWKDGKWVALEQALTPLDEPATRNIEESSTGE